MGFETLIEWCDHTFNPWRGCTKVSPGCAHCYAETLSHRNPGLLGIWGDQGTRVVASESMWREPLKWDKAAKAAGVRRRVFCASLADVFENRPDLIEPRLRLFDLIEWTPNLDWLLLTKRPENIAPAITSAMASVPGGCDAYDDTLGMLSEWLIGKPPKNVWLGVSVENQEYADKRIPVLLSDPMAGRIQLLPLPDEIERVLGMAVHSIAERLREQLVKDVPCYQGRP